LERRTPLELPRRKNEQSLKTLVQLGTKGFFPLFYDNWIEEHADFKTSKLTSQEKTKARQIMQKLVKHKSIDRKRTLLLALEDKERKTFIKAFMKMVEGQILDEEPELH